MKNYILPALIVGSCLLFVAMGNWSAQRKIDETQTQTNLLLTKIYAAQLWDRAHNTGANGSVSDR